MGERVFEESGEEDDRRMRTERTINGDLGG